MLDFFSTLSGHVRFLLQSLNETNADSVRGELSQFLGCGIDGIIVVLQACLDFLILENGVLKNSHVEAVIASVFRSAMEKPNFCTVFCQSLRNTDIKEDFLEHVSKLLHLSVLEKIGIGLALSDSENLEERICGKKFCIAQIEELNACPDSFDSYEQIQNIILFLQCSGGLSKHVDSFMQMLSLVQVKDVAHFVLTPLLSDELHESNLLRDWDSFIESVEDDFDAVLAEMEKEMSMADILRELGYGCMVDASHCKNILSLCLPLTEMTIARILGVIACNHAGLEDNFSTFSSFSVALGYNTSSDLLPVSSWNIEVLVQTIKQLAPATDWKRVIENLDHEGLYIPNEAAFSFLMTVYRHACQEPFPLQAICGSLWKNIEGQLSFLKHAVSSPPEVFTFAHSERQLTNKDVVHGHKLQLGDANHAWLCIDLLEALCKLAERGHATTVKLMLEYPLKHCPAILLLGVSHVNTAYNLLQHDVSSTVLPMMIKNSTNTEMIHHLWHVNPYLLLRGLVEVQNTEPDSSIRVVEICQELKILSTVLEMVPFSSGIRLAVIASQQELVNLEKWLSSNLNTYKDSFLKECVNFLNEIQLGGSQEFSAKPFHHSCAVFNTYKEITSAFLKVLIAHTGLISSTEFLEELEKLRVTMPDSNSGMRNGGTLDSLTNAGSGDDIEAEANSFFHKVLSGQLTIDAMIQMFARLKESSVEREQSIFECMISNLFEEYKYFPKYPERQLKIAAILFGSIIKHQFVTQLTLRTALRGVLDALQKPADSKMFLFGSKALEQFVDRLIEWPQYCNHILQISHLHTTHSDLVAFIKRALSGIASGHSDSEKGNNPNTSFPANYGSGELKWSSITQTGHQVSSSVHLQPKNESSFDDRNKAPTALSMDVKPLVSSIGQPSAPVADASSMPKPQMAVSSEAMLSTSSGIRASRGASTRFGSALNIDTLVAAAERKETPIEAPGLEVQDKISFIINNISTSNVEAKAKEFSEILKEPYHPWFAQYMVMKRASIEPNYHDLYVKFLEIVNSKCLMREIVQATYENCKVLLASELIKSSSEERSLLKNMGSWLGKLTIGRSQVLRAREIDLKPLIREAYVKGLLIAVVPFTSKILQSCRSSAGYVPPNPWTMGILGLLAEIYLMPNLKMNLKFDIEVLFNNLGVNMKEVTPTSLLKDRSRETEGNPDFSDKGVGVSQPQMISKVKSGITSTLPLNIAKPQTSGGNIHLLSQNAPLRLSSGTLMEDEKLAALGLSDKLPSAQRLCQAIPSQSPFSFSQEHTTLITDIRPLVIINQKLSALGLHLYLQRVVPIAMDRAIKEIVSSNVQHSVSIATQTTKELVLKDYALESDETRIYNAAHLMAASLAGSLARTTCKEPLRCSILSQLRSILQGLNVASDLLEKVAQVVTDDNLDLGCAAIEQAAIKKAIQTIDGEISQQLALRRKHGDPSFFGRLGSVGIVPEALRPRPGRLSLTQQQVYEDFVQLQWKNQSSQSTHVLSGGSLSVPGDSGMTGSMPGSTSGQVVPNSFGLGNSGRVNVAPEANKSTSAATLSALSIQVGKAAIALQSTENDSHNGAFPSNASASELHSANTAEIVKESTECPGSDISEGLLSTKDALDEFQIVSQKAPSHSIINREEKSNLDTQESDPFKEQVRILFAECYNICQRPGENDADFTHFFIQMHQNGLLKGDDMTERFFHVVTELAVADCLSSEVIDSENTESSQHVQTLSFLVIDSYAEFVLSLFKHCPDEQGSSKFFLLSKILTVTVRFIQKDAEEKKSSFNPRPYFRLFINWLLDLTSLEPDTISSDFQILTALANAFHALQPLNIPAFSFAWLGLISHRSFMAKLLTGNAQEGWPYVQHLVMDLLQFIEQLLRNNAGFEGPVRTLYKGALRVLLVLLHDYPEFLCAYHFTFCNVIPPKCIQMRNIILSACPINMRLRNSSPNIKIDLSPEINTFPRILSEVDAALKTIQMKDDVDEYLKTRQPGSSFLTDLEQRLLLHPSETASAGTLYNVPLINSLVLYIGMRAIEQLQERAPHAESEVNTVPLATCFASAARDIFETLTFSLDTEGRYIFLNAIANQLRYPNIHTHYFSHILLDLFDKSDKDIVQEQIARVLVERIIVNKPHPWGLLVTFTELAKNGKYNFWNQSFVKNMPEIGNLFRSVARLCEAVEHTGWESDAAHTNTV